MKNRRFSKAAFTAAFVVILLSMGIYSLHAFSAPEAVRRMGLRRCGQGDFPLAQRSVAGKGKMPSAVDLTLSSIPIGDQGTQSSCVGWALGYYYKTYEEEREHSWDVSRIDRRFSPSWLYNLSCGGVDGGTTFPKAFEVLLRYGIVDMKEFPYDERNCTRMPSSFQKEAAKPYRIKSYAALWTSTAGADLEFLKEKIAEGEPVALGIPVYENFYYCQDGWVDIPGRNDEYIGDHAVCAVGYDDHAGRGGGVKIVNSWGSGWGDCGYAYLSYRFLKNYVFEAWVMEDRDSDIPILREAEKSGSGNGLELRIEGENFGALREESKVLFGGKEARPLSWSDSKIEVELPQSVDCSLTVQNWAGEKGNIIRAALGPRIFSIDPEIPMAKENFYIYGSGFGDSKGEVLMNGESLEVLSWANSEINLKAPQNACKGTLTIRNCEGMVAETDLRIATSVWYFAEGCTLEGFEEWILIINAEDHESTVEITYMTPRGEVRRPNLVIEPNGRLTLSVNHDLPDMDVSVRIVSDGRIYAERSMYWGKRIEGHCSAASSVARQWFLAEGTTQGGFDTWLLIQNPSEVSASVKIKYLTDKGVAEKALQVGAKSRASIHVNDDIQNSDFSTIISSDRYVAVERSMYFGGMRGGHCSAAVQKASKQWYFAEGSTSGFNEWISIMNPNMDSANVEIICLTPEGRSSSEIITVNGISRATVNMNSVIHEPEVSVILRADREIVAERSMYWNNGSGVAGHNVTGLITPAMNQYLVEGCTAGGFEEWILLSNPSEEKTANVKIEFMKGMGIQKTVSISISPLERKTINANDFASGYNVSTKIQSSIPLFAERAIYWNNMGGGHAERAIPCE